MNHSGRILLEFLLGLLIAAGVVGLAPSHIRALRMLLTIHTQSEQEAACEREIAGSLLLNEPGAAFSREIQNPDCKPLLQLTCSARSAAAALCELSLRRHPARKPLEIFSLNSENT